MSRQGYLYQDIQMVRTVMYVVMLMVVAVACFNIVSTLVMAVNEKRSEIAILKTMGRARPDPAYLRHPGDGERGGGSLARRPAGRSALQQAGPRS